MVRKTYTYERQRRDIQRDINEFFGKSIQITPRAMAALQAGEAIEDKWPEPIGVLENGIMETLLRTSPACAMMLFHAGVDFEKLEFLPQRDGPAPLGEYTLELLFRGFDRGPTPPLTPSVRRVNRVGMLTDFDILTSPLEAALTASDPGTFAYHILKAADLEIPGHIRGCWRSIEDKAKGNACDEYLKGILRRIKVLKAADPSNSFMHFALYADDSGTIRVRPFGLAGISRLLTTQPMRDGHEYLYRGGILQPVSSIAPGISDDVLAQLEELLNSRRVLEKDFQSFFEQHPFLLTGLDFGKAHLQPILYKDDGTSLIPDFFLEKPDGGWDTLLDLKRPYEDMVIRRRNRTYFSQEIHNAVAQLRYYSEWFESPGN